MLSLQKLEWRKKALEHIDWDSEKKKMIQTSLTKEYTSSDEESTILHEEAIPFRVRTQHQLTWESTELTQVKESLDSFYREKLLRCGQTLIPYIRNEIKSKRPPPVNGFNWAIKEGYSNQ